MLIFLLPHERKKNGICNSRFALENKVFSFIYQKIRKGGSVAFRETCILCLSLQLSGYNSIGLCCWAGSKWMPLKLAWEIKFHNVLTGSNLKLYLIQLCFYSWGSWEEIQLRKLKEITCIIKGHIVLKTRLEAKFCGSQLSALSTLCTLTKTKQNDEFVAKLSISKSENLRWKEQCLPSCSQTGGFLWGKCRSHFFFSVYWLPRGLLP